MKETILSGTTNATADTKDVLRAAEANTSERIYLAVENLHASAVITISVGADAAEKTLAILAAGERWEEAVRLDGLNFVTQDRLTIESDGTATPFAAKLVTKSKAATPAA